MRLTTATLMAIGLTAVPVQAADVRDDEIMVVDQKCIEQKIANCLVESKIYEVPPKDPGWLGARCLFGTTQIGRTNDGLLICQPNDIHAALELPWERAGPIFAACRQKVESLPSYYGSPNCLKPLAQERIINALNVEIKRLSRQLCDASGGSKCAELDTVPEQ